MSKFNRNVPALVQPIPYTSNSALEVIQKEVNDSKRLDFFRNFKAIYYILRAFGLWPFSFVRDSNGKIQKPKVSKIGLLWFIVSIQLYVLAAFILLKYSKSLGKNDHKSRAIFILLNSNNARLALSLISIAISIVIDMCNRYKLTNIVKIFATFDKSVEIFFSQNKFCLI